MVLDDEEIACAGNHMVEPKPDKLERIAVDYVTVERDAFRLASRHPARFRLTCEIRPLRDGIDRWFLIAVEKLQSV